MGVVVAVAAPPEPVEPGSGGEAVVVVQNTTDSADEFAVSVRGPAGVWATVDPAILRLEAGQEGAVWVRFAPPRLRSIEPGSYLFTVNVASRNAPEAPVAEHGSVDVSPFAHIEGQVEEPETRGDQWTEYTVTLTNHGNQRATVEVATDDAESGLLFDIEPARVSVAPAEVVSVAVKVETPKTRKAVPFTVTATAAGREVLRHEAKLPDRNSLGEDLSRSAALLGGLLLVVVVFIVVLARGGGSSDQQVPSGGGGTQTLDTAPEAGDDGSGHADAGRGAPAADAEAPVEGAAPPADSVAVGAPLAPASFPTLVYIRNYPGSTRDLVVRSSGVDLRLRSNGATESAPALSPDSTRVAHVREEGGVWRLCVISAGGGEALCLVEVDSNTHVGWSDNNNLVYSRGSGLWQLLAAEPVEEPRRLPVDVSGGRFSISSEGDHVATVDGRSIVVRPLDGSPGTVVTVPEAPQAVALSPDNTQVAFVSSYQLYVAPVGGGPVRRLTGHGTVNGEPSWSRDSAWIVFRSNRSGSGDLYAVSAATSGGKEEGLLRITTSDDRDSQPHL